jgi:hypothetical protein
MSVADVWRSVPTLARISLSVQGALLLAVAALFLVTGLSLDWASVTPHVVILLALGGLWLYHVVVPDRRGNPLIPDLLLVVVLLVLLTNLASPAQYAAIAVRRPLVDGWLAAADRALGVSVPDLVAWTRGQGALPLVLAICYYSLLPQFILAPIITALVLKSRARLWEYFFHFHFCLLVTLVALLLFPARCVFSELGFESLLNQDRFVRHFEGFRSGALTVVRFDDLEGLISMPSFHVAGALIVTWAVRGRLLLVIPLAALNLGLVAATVFCGAHYFVDLPATLVLFLVSLLAFRASRDRLMPELPRDQAPPHRGAHRR